ncbi:helix-hairpin-helix domain-containing protein [Actinomadura atramentaria]|uniref:helix-hairpin-helix domain-containing protein n=1 Tax=Actinomadura atramentaria TaxID=1990 RepID=UPI0003716B1F|nr:helix-hairpin-helix domain-containing protein [Actinomadura atramentaria]
MTAETGTGTSTEPGAALAALLDRAGAPRALAAPALARLGAGAAALLDADPWRLLRVPGVTVAQADHFARALLGDAARPDDPRRGRALAEHVVAAAARRGHTVVAAADVVAELGRLGVADASRAVEDALDEGWVLPLTEEPEFDPEADPEDEPPAMEERVGAARWAVAEEAAAEGFARLTALGTGLLPDEDVRALRAGLAEDRSLALTAALRTGVSVWRGAAADVEDTALAVAGAAAAKGLRAAVAAPTARAAADLAARVPAGAGFAVASVHALLEPSAAPDGPPGAVVFGRGEQRPLELDLLVVTDAAGFDVEGCAVLVEACPDGAHLVLGAAPGAPPAAGPGRVLDDLEESQTVPVVELDPAEPPGPLASLVAAVRGGELVAVDAPDREVVVVPAASDGEAVHRAVQLVTDSIPRALGIPVEDVLAVAPAPGGAAGAAALNRALKERLNPGPGAVGGFDAGDRVLAAAALPAAPVGEPGVVTAAGPDGLTVEFASGSVTLAAADAALLRHGWAAPVALARFAPRAAVVAVFGADAPLSRPVAATAFGLARRHLSVVQGAGPALARAVRETGPAPRRTRLAGLVVV